MRTTPQAIQDHDALSHSLAAAAAGAPTVVLTVLGDGAIVTLAPGGHGTAAAVTHRWRLGPPSSASPLIGHDPPRPSDLEQAIEVIEDAVMPLARQVAAGSLLFVDRSSVAALRRHLTAEHGEPSPWPIDQVEALFNRLVAVAEGRPVARGGVPGGAAFAWQLLVLREAMHHWGFSVVRFAG